MSEMGDEVLYLIRGEWRTCIASPLSQFIWKVLIYDNKMYQISVYSLQNNYETGYVHCT